MPLLPPPPPVGSSQNDRFSPQRHKPQQQQQQFLVNSSRMTSSTTYMCRTPSHDPGPLSSPSGNLPPNTSGTYPPRSLGPLHSHMMSGPSGYSNRSTAGYGLLPGMSSRPLVLPIHPSQGLGHSQQMRHYPSHPSRSSNVTGPLIGNGGSNGPLSPHCATTLPLQTPQRGSAGLVTNTHGTTPVSRATVPSTTGSETLTRERNSTLRTSTPPKNNTSIIVTEDQLDTPALSSLPLPVLPDPDLDIMTEGLKLQQREWLEKIELKKLFSETARLTELIVSLTVAPPSDHIDLCKSIRHAVEIKIPKDLSRLQRRVGCILETQQANNKDIVAYCSEISLRNEAVTQLCEVDMKSAETELLRSKRRRKYEEEYEELAGEILTKKSRHLYKKELEQETAKLKEVQGHVARWRRISELRTSQGDIVLSQLRHLLQSLKDPTIILSLLDTPDSTNIDTVSDVSVSSV